MEEVYCRIYKMPRCSPINFMSIAKMQQIPLFRKLSAYKIFVYHYRSFFTNIRRRKRSLFMFIAFRLNSLLMTGLFLHNPLVYKITCKTCLDSTRLMQRKKFIRNYVRYFKNFYYWSLLYPWRLVGV